MIISFFRSLLFLLFTYSFAFAGGPWTQKKNGGYAQLSFSTISSNMLYNNNGNAYSLYRKVNDRTLQAYLEYGITENLTLIGNIPFKFVATGDETFQLDTALSKEAFPSGSLNGLSNISVAFKYKALDKEWKLAAQLKAATRTSVSDNTTGLQTGYDCWSYQPALHLGRSGNAAYVSFTAGLTFRSNHFSESFNATAEGGYGFFNRKTYLILVLDLDKSFLNDSTQNPFFLKTGLYVNNQEYLAYGLKINQAIGKHWDATLSILGAAYGNLVAQSPSINVGVAYKWE